MSRHKEAYVISYHEALCHDMSYVTTIVASLIHVWEFLYRLSDLSSVTAEICLSIVCKLLSRNIKLISMHAGIMNLLKIQCLVKP